jgi:hypothetical protein
MEFEKLRLMQAGHSALSESIVWLSRESDFYGYDILSFSGNEPDIYDRRHIEVKRCRLNQSGYLEFFLSRNEYTQAKELKHKFIFHLWWLKAGVPTVAIVESSLILARLPIDFSESNIWTECKVSVSIGELSETYEHQTEESMDEN